MIRMLHHAMPNTLYHSYTKINSYDTTSSNIKQKKKKKNEIRNNRCSSYLHRFRSSEIDAGAEIQNGSRRSRQLKLVATSHVCGAEMHARACTCAPRYARAKSWGRLFFEETGNVASRNNDRVENTSPLETFRVAPAAQFTTIKAEALALAPCTSYALIFAIFFWKFQFQLLEIYIYQVQISYTQLLKIYISLLIFKISYSNEI